MRTIHKYLLGNGFGVHTLTISGENVEILSIGLQSPIMFGYTGTPYGEEIYLWALLDKDPNSTVVTTVKIHLYGTGWELPSNVALYHIGTVQIKDIVYHVFQEIQQEI